ncbi:S-adenosyl-L-methionine-dependent methyltransferase [Usnea florida]
MHYDSDAALEHCASKIHLEPNQQVLDIGSGFSATGRFLASRYGAWVTGIELQRESHELAQLITARNADAGIVERVRSVNADFLTLTPESLLSDRDGKSSSASPPHFDHIISFLCINHISESAPSALFHQAALFLKAGGTLYIEDFYNNSRPGSHLTVQEVKKLETVMACPYLPSSSKYIADVQSAGFERVEFENVSEKWRVLVRARADRYRAEERQDAELRKFYDVVAEMLEGNVGGVRLSSVRR